MLAGSEFKSEKKRQMKSLQEPITWSLHLILTLGVNPFPYIFIFRTDLLRFLSGVFTPLHQLLHSDPLLRKPCDLQNNNGEKCGEEFAQHAVYHRNNFFAVNVFLKIKRYGKGLTQGYSADRADRADQWRLRRVMGS